MLHWSAVPQGTPSWLLLFSSFAAPLPALAQVVNDELVSLMGGNVADIEYAAPGQGPTVVLLAGLQGVGKTTACGKLALFFKKRVRAPA